MNKKIEEIISTAIGKASMCWESPEKAGEFKSDLALEIVAETLEKLSTAIIEITNQTQPLKFVESKESNRVVLNVAHYSKEEKELPEDIRELVDVEPLFVRESILKNNISSIQLDYPDGLPKYGGCFLTVDGQVILVKESLEQVIKMLS